MEMRVEQLSARADVTVDTIRYYQSKGLLDPPRREGRVASETSTATTAR
jgi:DNA-binding transcriptional MerR regulator